jgi:hypothetical protein
MVIKGKTKELLVKQLKTCEKKMKNSLTPSEKTKLENHGHQRRRRGANKGNV